MEYAKQLTKEEYDEFMRQTSSLHSDEKTREACLRYFLEYKATLPNIPNDKLNTTLRCAYFIAEKSQTTYNLKGYKVRGIGLSLNQFLKNNQLDDFMIILKDFLKRVKITDAYTKTDLEDLFKLISFLITFNLKFEKTMQKLELKYKINESFGYSKIFSSFIWLLYVDAKNRILKNNLQLIENTCMLAHVIAFMLIYSWEYLRPASFMDKKFNSQKEISLFVQERVLEIFLIKNVDTYGIIAYNFDKYFTNLIDTNIIKMNPSKVDFLSPDNINLNYKKLDYYYQKALTPEDIDERIFFKDRAANLTPSKFTPFSRHGHVSKLATMKYPNKPGQPNFDSNKENFSSHRILTYDMIEKSESQTPKGGVPQMNEIKLPRQVINSPSMTKPTLICSTPVTSGMEMYNYLNDKARKSKYANYPARKLDSSMMMLIDRLLDKSGDKKNDKTREVKSNLIFSLYKLISEEYGQQHPHDRYNEAMCRALLALSTYMVIFVSNISMSFEDIEQCLYTDLLEQWKALEFIIKFDRSMPAALKIHMHDLEVSSISSKIWMDEDLRHCIQEYARGSTFYGAFGETIERLFKKLLVHIAYQISQMAQVLKLYDRVAENIFDTMKHLLVHLIELLHHRHIDQMVICSIYANCKASHVELKFQEIKEKYEEVNSNNKAMHDEIMHRVYINYQQRLDIIKFYNTTYIQVMKPFITSIKENQMVPTSRGGAPVLQSPLRAVIPKELSFNRVQNNIKKTQKTPQTQQLYAYNYSPLLKHDMNAFKGQAIQSRKVIDFDEEEKQLRKKYTEMADQDDGLSQTNDFISKKFKKPPTATQHHNPSHKVLFKHP